MGLEDYGIVDELTPAALNAIDQGLIAELSRRERKVSWLIGDFMGSSAAAIPGLPDYFYLLRIEQMVDSGVLVVSSESEHLVHCKVRLA